MDIGALASAMIAARIGEVQLAVAAKLIRMDAQTRRKRTSIGWRTSRPGSEPISTSPSDAATLGDGTTLDMHTGLKVDVTV